MGKLKISALAADFRTDHYLSPIFFGKPCRVPVPLNQSHVFIKKGNFYIYLFFYSCLNGFRLFRRPANNQYFFICQPFLKIHQKLNPGITDIIIGGNGFIFF